MNVMDVKASRMLADAMLDSLKDSLPYDLPLDLQLVGWLLAGRVNNPQQTHL